MILRYLVLFGGIVLMITGCNGLVSQQFGTHHLRTIDTATALAEGLGDADYVELTGAVIGEPSLTGAALRAADTDYILRPLWTAAEQERWNKGETVTVSLVSWTEVPQGTRPTPTKCDAPAYCSFRGLVTAPTPRKNPGEHWPAQRIKLADRVTYIQLGEAPLPWYWNLALFLGGGLLAIVPESRRFARRTKP